jgi:hypothetical protein
MTELNNFFLSLILGAKILGFVVVVIIWALFAYCAICGGGGKGK